MAGRKPPKAIWRPIEDLPPEAERWGSAHYRECAGRWRALRERLRDPAVDSTLLDIWLRERNRAFAIETGQIEGLYTLRGGVTEQLIAEVFAGECPPVISLDRRRHYIRSLEAADRGDLRPFIEFLAVLAAENTLDAIGTADDVLQRWPRRRHGNGGVTARDRDGTWRYRPPDMTPRELLILAGRAVPAPGEDRPAWAGDVT